LLFRRLLGWPLPYGLPTLHAVVRVLARMVGFACVAFLW